MSKRHKPHDIVYAILRSDDFHAPTATPEVKVTVKAIVRSREVAEKEVARLNQVNADKDCHYWWRLTRLFPSAAEEVEAQAWQSRTQLPEHRVSRRAIKGVLRNFIETYTSRYSDFDGYWLFGFIVDGLQQMSIDLLNPTYEHTATSPEQSAIFLAAARFREQVEKAGLSMSYIREARLLITKSPDSKAGVVNGHSCLGYQMKFLATAISDYGKKFESIKLVFAASHDPYMELKSARATISNG